MSTSVPPVSRRPRPRTRLRATLAAFAVTAAAVPALVLATGQPAYAAGTVTPSKTAGIDPAGETLTVAGSGFDSSGGKGIYLQFCKQTGTSGTAAGRPAAANCSGAQAWITGAGLPGTSPWTGEGTFSFSLAVTAAFKDVDCRAEGTTCGIVTRNDHNQPGVYDQDTFTPITFAADPPVFDRVVTPSKTAGIDPAGETLTVAGSGFDSSGGKGIYLQFCKQTGTSGTAAGRPAAANCSGAQAWITGAGLPGTSPWTGEGTFSFSLAVTAAFKDVDCRAEGTTCGIVTRNDHNQPGVYDQDTFTPITFAADAPVEPTGPELTVTPTTDLDSAGDTVTVTGSGYPEGQGVYVRFCQAPTGTVGTAAGRPAADVCDGQGLWVSPNPPDPSLPRIVDGAFTVELPVAGRFAGTSDVVECTADDACGAFVRRDHVGGATDFALDDFTPLRFDPASTPPVIEEPEEPTLNDVEVSVSKATDVLDGESITVDGAGFTPEQGVYVQWCAAPTGQVGTAAGRAGQCYPEQDGTHTVWVTPIAASGEFRTPLTAERSFTLADGTTEIDCSVAGACGVFVRRDHNGGAADYSQDAFVPVAFGDGTAPETPDATLAADRTTDLDPGGDTVTVTGEAFRPGVDYFVALCDEADLVGCDFDEAVEVTAEPAADRSIGDPGSFSVDLPVRAAFDDVDCLADGTSCAVSTWAVSLSEPGDEVVLPVSFAPRDPAGPTTPVDGTPSAAAPGGTTGGGILARTGAETAALAVGGLLATLAGAVLVAGSRRRTARA